MKILSGSIVTLLLVICVAQTRSEEFKRSESGLQYRTVKVGTGPVAKVGQIAVVHEIMKKQDGSVVADTFALNFTPQFELGADQAIKGVDEGVVGMKVGEIREFIVPPSLSKRKVYPANLSPEDILHYEVLLVRLVEKKPQTPNKAPEPTPGSVTPRATESKPK